MLLILFDIDGTLMTSDGRGRHSISQALEDVCGRRISTNGVTFSGRTDPAIVRDILTNAGFTAGEVERLMPACLDCYAEHLLDNLKPEHVTVLPGVIDIVHAFSERDDLRLGLLTGNLEETAYAKITAGGLKSYFSFGAFGSDYEDRNDLPPVAIHRANALSEYTFLPESTVIIGDTEQDVVCSRVSGAHAVAVSTGRISYETLQECNPDLLMRDLSDPDPLIQYLNDLQ